jgi:c-di-GMP phosphodiesterase
MYLNAVEWRPMNAKLRVLVVEDHTDTREHVCELLRIAGYEVLEAANGSVALELLVAHVERQPCLIILDLEMPVMTGWEFLSLIRNYHRLSRIPVLVTSGSDACLDELSRSGVVGFLRKPYALDELLTHVVALGRPRSLEEEG